MSILSELQSRRLGLIELLSMGFDVYLKNLKPILLVYCTTLFPFRIILSALITQVENSPSGSFSAFYYVFLYVFLIVMELVSLIYFIAVSVIIEKYLHGINTSYQSVVSKIFSIFIPLVFLYFIFFINVFLRSLLLFIPGIIYIINNGYYWFSCIFRDQRGKAAFAYSRSIVRGNWWRVFFFYCLIFLIHFGLQTIFSKILSTIPFMNTFWVSLLSQTLPPFIGIGIGIGSILLFINLEFQKSLER